MKKALFLACVAAAAAVSAAVRHFDPITLAEGASASVKVQGADDAKAGLVSVAGVIVRDKEVIVTGLGIGTTDIQVSDVRGVFADFKVTVVPSYWDVLAKIFEDDPEIGREVIGGKVILTGATANSETLERVNQAKALDPDRIVSQVTYSPEALKAIVTDFLRRSDATNIAVNIVGREVCLSGKVFDPGVARSLSERVLKFLREFPGVTVNVENIRVYKQKILISIEFVEWNDTRAKNLGIKPPDSIIAEGNFSYGYDWTRALTDNRSSKNEPKENTKDGTTFIQNLLKNESEVANNLGQNLMMKTGVEISDVKFTINLAKQNGVARKTYGTTLATQSGEPVTFKNGGTYYIKTQAGGLGSGDLKQFDYGYNIVATPVIIDRETVDLAFDLDYSNLDNAKVKAADDYSISRYATKSKYIVRPGETIVLSGYKEQSESDVKDGWPILSHIPILNWIFGNRNHHQEEKEMLLVVTTDWIIEDSDAALKRLDELKQREVDAEMP